MVDGYRIHARVPSAQPESDVAGDPVVLVHGLGVSSRYMVPTLRELASSSVPVFAPDLPGFGRSDKPRHVLSLAELADSLAAWMSAQSIGRAVLLGNSLGCQIIAVFAQRHPGRLSAAVLVGPTPDPAALSPWRQALRLVRDAPHESPSEAAYAVADYWRAGPRRMWRTLNEALQSPMREQLTWMRVPTLIVRGAEDPIVSQRWVEQATALLSRGRLVIIPGGPHAANYSAAPVLVREVRRFLDQDG